MATENIQRHPHLLLPRAEIEPERRQRPGFGGITPKPFDRHGFQINTQVDSVLQQFQSRAPGRPRGIDPKLLLRVRLERAGAISDNEWRRNGLILVSEDRDGITVLLASEPELRGFKHRLHEYQKGPRPKCESAPYASLFNAILEVQEYGPENRRGKLLQGTTIIPTKRYALDLELWHPGDIQTARQIFNQVSTFITEQGGRVVDNYVGASVCLARLIVKGDMINQLLQLEPVARLDLPPKPSLTVAEVLQLTLENFPAITKPPDDAPRVCVIDSGIASGHPMLSPAIGDSISVPSSLGPPTDEHGHGTQVAGLALYNDISECIKGRLFSPSLGVLSAKVTNKENQFPDDKLISNQIREAIEYFHKEYKCRVFNVSLGDDRLVYDGGNPSIWAWTLDDIARKLNVIIVVSAGNFWPGSEDDDPLDILNGYPRYLLDKVNRIIEPATAAIPLTVGALAHLEAPHGPGSQNDVALKAVARVDEPSPFTRIGPGIGDAIKPELCEYGGNLIFDYRLNRLQDKNAQVEIVSFNYDYARGRLFTFDRGTSLAAPKISHCAARLLSIFPRASANLIRALLASSASIPESANTTLQVLDKNASFYVCGYGKPNLDIASYSTDSRVTLFAEEELVADRFHVYEIPLPDVFRRERGQRNISVTLAFDPPTRRTRKDYLGFMMKFWLVRGKTFEQVKRLFRKSKPEEESVKGVSGTRFECDLEPGHRIRERGTLQKGIFTMRQNPNEMYGDTYCLVIQCARNWSDEEKQRYAIVVVLEHLGLETTLHGRISLYQTVQERIEAREHIRIRR